jgi:hypothetical protein
MSAEIFEGLAEIYAAGATRSRQWSMNTDRQQEAEVLEAMEIEARHQAQKARNEAVEEKHCGRRHEHHDHLWLVARRAVHCSGGEIAQIPPFSLSESLRADREAQERLRKSRS